MARARNIKPGFFKNYQLADLGPLAQILFAGLWVLADREGRLEDKPRFIKAEVFPYYDCDVDKLLTKLAEVGFIKRYSVKDVKVISVINFDRHQKPHHTEKASVLPEEEITPLGNPHEIRTPDIHGELTVNSPLNNGYVTVNSPSINGEYRADSLIPDSLITYKTPHTPQGGRVGKSATSLKTYLQKCKEDGVKPIPEGDAVFEYSKSVGIPLDFLRLQWFEFKARYDLPDAKRYKDWKAVFRKSVRGNWFRLWFLGNDGYVLTTTGQQAKRLHKEAA